MNDEQISFIGKWAIRIGAWDGGWHEHGKAHLVDSEITDRLVMRCGRELKLETGDGRFREFVARRLDTRCLQCRGYAGE